MREPAGIKVCMADKDSDLRMDPSNMKLIDVHCHLQDGAFDVDRDEIVRRARQASVASIVISSLSLVDAPKTLEVARRYQDCVYVCIGLNPTHLDFEEVEEVRGFIRTFKNRIVGVGEVGLDYYWVREEKSRELQIRLLKEWIGFSEEIDLPLVIHSRSAGKYVIQILLNRGFKRVIMHAYDGRAGWAVKAAEEGIYFSIPTSVWHSRQKQKLVKALPLESLMVESDAPVLSPMRGDRNEPANLVYAIRRIAELKDLPEEEVADTTTRNAEKFFQLKDSATHD